MAADWGRDATADSAGAGAGADCGGGGLAGETAGALAGEAAEAAAAATQEAAAEAEAGVAMSGGGPALALSGLRKRAPSEEGGLATARSLSVGATTVEGGGLVTT